MKGTFVVYEYYFDANYPYCRFKPIDFGEGNSHKFELEAESIEDARNQGRIRAGLGYLTSYDELERDLGIKIVAVHKDGPGHWYIELMRKEYKMHEKKLSRKVQDFLDHDVPFHYTKYAWPKDPISEIKEKEDDWESQLATNPHPSFQPDMFVSSP